MRIVKKLAQLIVSFSKMNHFAKGLFLRHLYWRLKTACYYQLFFNKIGKKTVLIRPIQLCNPQKISLGNQVLINDFTCLFVSNSQTLESKIIIEDGTYIGRFNNITCDHHVHIGKKVMTANNVFITDNSHDYKNIELSIRGKTWEKRNAVLSGETSIGDESWIGANAVVINCKIGKHCIIGANSVVSNDIPDYSVAVGSPAKVIKKYNFEKKFWEKC